MPQHVQYKCWSTTNETPHVLKYPLCCPAKSRPGVPSQRGQKCWVDKQTVPTLQSKKKSTTQGREKSTSSNKTATHQDKLPLLDLYPGDVRQLALGKPAHLTLQRNPLKDESQLKKIPFSFVTVVLLEILVPKIN